jgi:hypothetical protein
MNSLGRDIANGDVVLIDPEGMNKALTEFQLLLRTGGGFGMRSSARGSAVYGKWLDGSEPEGVRMEGGDIFCSCRSETWQCPGCGEFEVIYFKESDGKNEGNLGEVVKGQSSSCGREFDESSWTCAAPLDDRSEESPMKDEAVLAEFWWMRQGQRIPLRGTVEWKAMFDAWRAMTASRED